LQNIIKNIINANTIGKTIEISRNKL